MRVPRWCRLRSPHRAVAAGASLALALAACGSATGASRSGAASAGGGPAHHGTVDVLSAGSLLTVMDRTLGPAFHRATGYTVNNISAGSKDLASAIKTGTDVADVFISASPAVNASLEGRRNGGWVSWYASFASSPLVLAYYPKSRFAAALRTQPWYDVIGRPGFRLGRTNPSQDPGGVLAEEALLRTARARHLPALRTLGTETSDEYQETAYLGDVAAGQLDGALMYLADANAGKLPHVPLTGTDLRGAYTVTLVDRAPHRSAAEAFIRFLLGPTGSAALRADQFGITSPPVVRGTGVPAALRGALGS